MGMIPGFGLPLATRWSLLLLAAVLLGLLLGFLVGLTRPHVRA